MSLFNLRTVLLLVGAGVVSVSMGSVEITAAFGDTRSLSVYNIHNKETTTVIFKKNGKFIPSALKKLNWVFRDWRRNEPTKMDPRVFDIIWEIHTELGSKKPVHLISGYRSLKTNNMLRKSRGGQAKRSRHILGKAADIHFPDVPVRRLRYSALVRERGGVGYYPTSALPFVHVDTGRVRHWPRMGRYELALLFPDGKTKHRPRSGKRITKRDVKIAKRKHAKLAQKVAAFHQLRSGARRNTLLAQLENSKPSRSQDAADTPVLNVARGPTANPRREKLQVPRPVLASLGVPVAPLSRLFGGKSETAKNALPKPAALGIASAGAILPPDEDVQAPLPVMEPPGPIRLASADPLRDLLNENDIYEQETSKRSIAGAFLDLAGWANAPEYDPEHPSELSYRPFPVGPLLNEEPSVDDPALSRLIHPDLATARDYIGLDDSSMPLRFKPGLQFAEMLWSDLFTGGAVTNILSAEFESGSRRGKKVRTAARQ
ncbi:MAG: DUF882 domain-containing protein [Hyphomicrobiaceae bacterium]